MDEELPLLLGIISRIEIEVLLTTEHFQRVLIVDERFILSAMQRNKRVVVAKTAGVIDEMAESDSSSVGRKFRDEFDIVIQQKFHALSGQNNRRRRELLGNRGNVERCVRRNRSIIFQICDAEPCGVNGLTVSENANGTAGSVCLIPRSENMVEVRFDFRRQNSGPQHV